MKYIGHLDLAKTWERILRRAQIDLAYSQGFNARPKMQLSPPLPLGMTSDCEMLDMWLSIDQDGRSETDIIPNLIEHISRVSPPGLPIYSITEVAPNSPSLQMLAQSAIYKLSVEGISTDELRKRVQALWAEPAILRERRDKTYDLKPLIQSLEVDENGKLVMQLVIVPQGASGRPDEVALALGLEGEAIHVSYHRTALHLRTEDLPNVQPNVQSGDVRSGDGLPDGDTMGGEPEQNNPIEDE